jgi:hypothetical protein
MLRFHFSCFLGNRSCIASFGNNQNTAAKFKVDADDGRAVRGKKSWQCMGEQW